MPAIRTIELPACCAGFRLYDSTRATDCSSLPGQELPQLSLVTQLLPEGA
jgi:hypothetical protein